MLEVGPGIVDRLRAEGLGLAVVVCGAVHRFGAGGDQVLVDRHMRACGQFERALCVELVNRVSIRVAAVGDPWVDGQRPRRVLAAMVLRVHLHMQAVLIEFVGHVHKHVERVAREVRRAPAERHGRRGEPLEGPEVAGL